MHGADRFKMEIEIRECRLPDDLETLLELIPEVELRLRKVSIRQLAKSCSRSVFQEPPVGPESRRWRGAEISGADCAQKEKRFR
jgi:hypothetical protein